MRVPLLIQAPGLGAAIDDRPAQQIDVAPTVLDLLGLPPHPSFQGISLVAPDPDPDRPIFLVVQSSIAHQYAVVRNGYKYIYDVRRSGWALMDLNTDPGEMNSHSDEHLDVGVQLNLLLGTWRRLQLDYYSDASEHIRTYPPVLVD